MKLLTFMKQGKQALAVKTDQGMIDVEAALTIKPSDNVPTNIMQVIEGKENAMSVLENYICQLSDIDDRSFLLNENEIDWEPCITNPNKIICIGLNYRKHADEMKAPYPKSPILFNKFNNTLTGHKANIKVPKVTDKLDYEAELGVVIGKEAKDVSKENALDHVFGYCVANDLSARDLQQKTPQWLLGKTCDDFCPVGPFIISADEVGDPNNLMLKTTLNGEIRQQSNTSDMIFYVDELVSYISQYMTLAPGDLILTGTPEGVILGYPKESQVFIQPGDDVTIEIEKLGTLTNHFVSDN